MSKQEKPLNPIEDIQRKLGAVLLNQKNLIDLGNAIWVQNQFLIDEKTKESISFQTQMGFKVEQMTEKERQIQEKADKRTLEDLKKQRLEKLKKEGKKKDEVQH